MVCCPDLGITWNGLVNSAFEYSYPLLLTIQRFCLHKPDLLSNGVDGSSEEDSHRRGHCSVGSRHLHAVPCSRQVQRPGFLQKVHQDHERFAVSLPPCA